MFLQPRSRVSLLPVPWGVHALSERERDGLSLSLSLHACTPQRRSLSPSLSLATGEGKKRDPGNEVGVVSIP